MEEHSSQELRGPHISGYSCYPDIIIVAFILISVLVWMINYIIILVEACSLE